MEAAFRDITKGWDPELGVLATTFRNSEQERSVEKYKKEFLYFCEVHWQEGHEMTTVKRMYNLSPLTCNTFDDVNVKFDFIFWLETTHTLPLTTDQGCPSVRRQIACAAKQCTVGMQPTHTAGGETPVYFYCSSPLYCLCQSQSGSLNCFCRINTPSMHCFASFCASAALAASWQDSEVSQFRSWCVRASEYMCVRACAGNDDDAFRARNAFVCTTFIGSSRLKKETNKPNGPWCRLCRF